jgi:hypothetical protein
MVAKRPQRLLIAPANKLRSARFNVDSNPYETPVFFLHKTATPGCSLHNILNVHLCAFRLNRLRHLKHKRKTNPDRLNAAKDLNHKSMKIIVRCAKRAYG